MDFAIRGNRCFFIDLDKVVAKFRDIRAALNELAQLNFDISQFLDKNQIAPQGVEKYSILTPENIHPNSVVNISEMIKTGMGNPILPGSSIKGALRTVIFWKLWQGLPHQKQIELLEESLRLRDWHKADKVIMDYLFTENPQTDFFRGLQIPDAGFSQADIQVTEVKILNLDHEGHARWLKKKKTEGEEIVIHCEALQPGKSASAEIKIDDLQFDGWVGDVMGFSDKKSLLMSLSSHCNDFAEKLIQEEKTFFEQSETMAEMARFYETLSDILTDIRKEESSFLLHLGWGIGWRGVTGNLLDPYYLERFREQYKLGVPCFPFPKTREVAFQNDGQHALGWIKMTALEERQSSSPGGNTTNER